MLTLATSDRLRFPATIFLSAFLLFWVQLILGKFILPWFGGTPAVWTTCMLFFQWVLLLGYVYAHLLTEHLKPASQTIVHGSVLLATIAFLFFFSMFWESPITPAASWRPDGSTAPVIRIVALLSISAGLPYFALSASNPLLQAWYRRADEVSAYRLYAVSNAGSFLALLAFPLFLEPAFSLRRQGWLWFWFYLLFVVGCFACALGARNLAPRDVSIPIPSPEMTEMSGAPQDSPGPRQPMLWFAFSASASAFFLATTNQLCQDVAVVPLLWVLPLSLYLLSFILCFEHPRWYARNLFHAFFAFALVAACFVLFGGGLGSLRAQVVLYLLTLFAGCMVCHGELARSKPVPRLLTSFYLCVALGGAAGGMFVALVAPRVFHGFWEYQLSLWAIAALLSLILLRERDSWLYRMPRPAPALLLAIAAALAQAAILGVAPTHRLSDFLAGAIAGSLLLYFLLNRARRAPEHAREKAVPLCSIAALLVLAWLLAASAYAHSGRAIVSMRSFYGTLAVVPRDGKDSRGDAYSLVHGRVVHGFQLRTEPYDRVPTAYYAPSSGIGLALTQAAAAARSRQQNLTVGAIGLGAGTLAAYAHRGDSFRFYEINPQVIAIATNPAYFTYVANSSGNVQIVSGDARLSLEREAELGQLQNFDVLALDAFSGDAVPAHLLTLEAFALYLKHLREPKSILAIHITNTYLDLRPVVLADAAYYHLNSVWIRSPGDGVVSSDSDWMLLSEGALPMASNTSDSSPTPAAFGFRPWTDDYSNLFRVLRK